MTKQEAIKTLKRWLEQVENVPTNIKGKKETQTGRPLTPVEESKYFASAELAGLTREEVQEILEKGFPTEKPTKKMIVRLYKGEHDGIVPYTRKWIELMKCPHQRKVGYTYRIVNVQDEAPKVFIFANGMTLEYKGKRKGVNAACIAVRDGRIVACAFSTKGSDGIRKAAKTNYRLLDKKGKGGSLYFSK